MILCDPQSFAEALEMHHFSGSQEPQRLRHIRIFHHPEQIVIGRTGFLLCCQILKQIRQDIPFDWYSQALCGIPAAAVGHSAAV